MKNKIQKHSLFAELINRPKATTDRNGSVCLLSIIFSVTTMLTGFGYKKQLSDQNLTTVKSNVKLAGLASVAGDVVGKITVGYQGWFSCVGDGSPITNGWWHWSSGSDAPNTGNIGINAWPDTREFTKSYPTGFNNLGNGQPASLFSSYDD